MNYLIIHKKLVFIVSVRVIVMNQILFLEDMIKFFPCSSLRLKGDLDALLVMEKELLDFLRIQASFMRIELIQKENIRRIFVKNTKRDELEHSHEQKLREDYGPVYFIKNFPNFSSPFWNMRAI